MNRREFKIYVVVGNGNRVVVTEQIFWKKMNAIGRRYN